MSLGDPVPKKLKLFQLGWTRWQPDWKIEITSDDFSSLTSRWIFKLFYRNVSWLFLNQNCSNCSARMNKMAARGKNRKTFNWLLHINQWMDFEIISQDCFLSDPYSKLLKPFCLDEKMAARAKKKTKKTLKQLLFLNQLMDFEMISQECCFGWLPISYCHSDEVMYWLHVSVFQYYH